MFILYTHNIPTLSRYFGLDDTSTISDVWKDIRILLVETIICVPHGFELGPLRFLLYINHLQQPSPKLYIFPFRW